MLRNVPIRRKLMLIMLVVSLVVMLLMRGVFFIYEFIAFRQAIVRELTTLEAVIEPNCTAALAHDNRAAAEEILATLQADSHVTAAALYDETGRLFAQHPSNLPPDAAPLPTAPGASTGFRFARGQLAGFQPVRDDGRQLGMLYLRYEAGTILREWWWASLGLSAAVMTIVLLVSFLLAHALQRQITRPVFALVKTARTVTERQDYSVRATKIGRDELGTLTDDFNQMLSRIEAQSLEIRRNEAQLQTVIENLSEGLVVSDLKGQLLHFNRAALELHGFGSLEETRRHVNEFSAIFELAELDGTVLPVENWPLARILRGEPVRDWEVRIRRLQSGWQRIFNYSGTLVRDQDGRPMLAIVTLTDITERKRAREEIEALNRTLEQRVRERTAQLEAANQELEAFSYSVSHDLRAPVRHMAGFAALLDKHAGAQLDEQGRRYLATIAGAARKMGLLIDDLLAFSRLSRTSLKIAPVEFGPLVADVIREARFPADPPEWRISPLPAVSADASLMRQVWINLLGNAVKYSRPVSQPVVEVSAEADNGEIVFVVRDNGVGFDPRYRDKLFNVFSRLHSETEFEGTGIGLALVRRIVARHGGRTWAESAPGRGAAFYFTLPARAEASSV
jgi:PAS domain S-box-containing protein